MGVRKGKVILFSAPSGSGKTTIVRRLLEQLPQLAFSVSCTTRPRRSRECDGRDYYFISPEEFRKKIREEAFLEWEEVYPDRYYGTLRVDLQRNWARGKAVVFELDVVGGLKLKRQLCEAALAIFVKPPSLGDLKTRLEARNTEAAEERAQRLAQASREMAYEKDFDRVLVNRDLEVAVREAHRWVQDFLKQE